MPRSLSPLLRALAGEAPDPPPVWILRQAGRYMADYRALRARYATFLGLVADPDACAEAALQPVVRYGPDASIVFSDILVALPPLGLDLSFCEGQGPVLAAPLRTEDIPRLPARIDPGGSLLWPVQAVRRTRAALPPHLPLIGFCGAPWTLACYALEGRGGSDFPRARALLHGDPALLEQLLSKLSGTLAELLCAQAQAGANVLQIFESWAGLVSPSRYREWILPSLSDLVGEVRARTGLPVIVYANGAAGHLESLASTGCQAVGVDWKIDLIEAAVRMRPGVAVMGNFDPALLLARQDAIEQAASHLRKAMAGRPWIANLGHGILPSTPEDAPAHLMAILRQSAVP